MKFSRTLVMVTVPVLMLLTACGSDSTSTTTTPTVSTGGTANEAASTGSSSAGGSTPSITAKPAADSGKAGQAFCASGLKLSAQMDAATANLGSASGDTKKSLDALVAVFAELSKSAPNDIKADFATLSEGFGNFAKVLGKFGYDYKKVLADPDALKSLQAMSDPKFEQASANLEAWVAKNCPALADK